MYVKRLLQGNRLQSSVALVVVSFLHHIIYFNTYFFENHAQLWQLLREALCKTFTNPDPHMTNGFFVIDIYICLLQSMLLKMCLPRINLQFGSLVRWPMVIGRSQAHFRQSFLPKIWVKSSIIRRGRGESQVVKKINAESSTTSRSVWY